MTKYLTRQSPGIRIDDHAVASRSGHFFYETYHHETNPKINGPAGKLDVGEHLNNLLAVADKLMQNPEAPFDEYRTNRDMFESIDIVVNRIARQDELQTEAEAAPDATDRKKAYRAVLDRFAISPEQDNFHSKEAAKYLAGETKIHRFCVVTRDAFDGDTHAYANADHDTMEAARRCAIQRASPESSVVIINLDNGEGWDLTTIDWRTVAQAEPPSTCSCSTCLQLREIEEALVQQDLESPSKKD